MFIKIVWKIWDQFLIFKSYKPFIEPVFKFWGETSVQDGGCCIKFDKCIAIAIIGLGLWFFAATLD